MAEGFGGVGTGQEKPRAAATAEDGEPKAGGKSL